MIDLLQSFALNGAQQHIIAVMMALMLLDIVSGLIKAVKQRKLNSEMGMRGISQKAASLVLFLALHVIAMIVPGNPPIALAYGAAYSLFEVISIFENVGETGAPLPTYITGILRVFDSLRINEDQTDD